ncbi:Hypothetical predicted protein [Olea europaea subsp. europaea]|uniref:Uncharacterized protein n=1 Tax=Olea europaea subsp. europaea TaxID=158383 RepID=A0A8S0P924_OLEEU|nr:Hypothetical predicted protein [Olea europaea subsp. europaea]
MSDRMNCGEGIEIETESQNIIGGWSSIGLSGLVSIGLTRATPTGGITNNTEASCLPMAIFTIMSAFGTIVPTTERVTML